MLVNQTSLFFAQDLALDQGSGQFLAIEETQSRNALNFQQRVLTELVLWILPGWPVARDESVEFEAGLGCFRLHLIIERCYFLAVWTPIVAIFIRLTSEKHHAFLFVLA